MLTDNEVQDRYLYTYKGNEYFISSCDNVELKDPSTGEWLPAVVYYPADETDPRSKCVRTLEDFKSKFKRVL
jgi:hypothetical protein